MSRLLPAIATRADFHRVRNRPIDEWRPALRALGARHGFPDEPVQRFASGANPVFSLGDRLVVKLVPHLWSNVVQREIECLQFLADKTTLPVARVVAEGRIEDWTYLVSTRLPGSPLDQVWPLLGPEEKDALAGELGGLLRGLHQIPINGLRPGGIVWEEFCENAIASWTARRDLQRLPAPLRADGPRFLAQVNPRSTPAPLVLLHGDLAPENMLVEHGAEGWRISGVLDFGNAMTGDPLFDLTAPTVLLAPGQAEIVGRILASCGGPPALDARTLRRRLMALTLIHPMADLPDCLALLKGTGGCLTWGAVAERFWPG
jgi:hygromycin-B 7''-O-kinase